jgi:ribonuclease HI
MAMFDPNALKIHIDGSCLKNPGGAGGFCAWIEYPLYWDKDAQHLESRGCFNTTNNRMELRAYLFAHEWVLDNKETLEAQHVQIMSDSKYVCEGHQSSLYWMGNDWCNQSGRKMENVDLWKDVLRIRRNLRGRPRISVVKVDRRSSALAINVDNGAKKAATQPMYIDEGYQPGKVGRARKDDRKAAKPYPATGERLTVKIYGTRIVARGVQSVKFEVFSEREQRFVDKYSAQTTDEIGNLLHRGNAFVIQMNAVLENPRIVEIVEALSRDALAQPMLRNRSRE